MSASMLVGARKRGSRGFEARCWHINKWISKLDAAVTQLANDAARGDKKAIQLSFSLLHMLEPAMQPESPREVIIYSGVLAEADKTV